jgi:alpha-glucosidase
MGNGEFRWAPEFMNENTLAYINNGILVLANFSGDPVVIPAGDLLVTTQHDLRLEGELEHDQVVWVKLQ